MPFKCLICADEFQPRKQPADFHGVVKNIVATFSYYLVPNSSLQFHNYCLQFCSSCCSQYLQSVHERHIRIAGLRAQNSTKASQFSSLLQKSSAESQEVDILSTKAAEVLPSGVETTSGNPIQSQQLAPPVDFKYLEVPYQKFSVRGFYKCAGCQTFKCKSLSQIRTHIRHVHLGQVAESGGKSYSEDKESNRITYYGKYVCEKLPNGSFQCGSCDFVSKGRLANMLGHIRMKHASTRRVYSRWIEVSPNKFEYNGLTAERTADGSFLCGYCPFTTKFAPSIRQHLKEIHAKGTSKVCEICGKVFKNDRRLYSHMQTHPTGADQKCTQCGKCFDTKAKMWGHFVRVHKQYRPPCTFRTYVCEICGKEYKSKEAFKTHLSSVHQKANERKKFECQVCAKIFACYASLYVHMNSHTGKKDYTCDVCGMKFTQAYSVVRHKKVVHNSIGKDQSSM